MNDGVALACRRPVWTSRVGVTNKLKPGEEASTRRIHCCIPAPVLLSMLIQLRYVGAPSCDCRFKLDFSGPGSSVIRCRVSVNAWMWRATRLLANRYNAPTHLRHLRSSVAQVANKRGAMTANDPCHCRRVLSFCFVLFCRCLSEGVIIIIIASRLQLNTLPSRRLCCSCSPAWLRWRWRRCC